jgi:ribosome biogenesis GTPase A
VSLSSYACSIMYRMQLPLVVVWNKKDLVSTEFAQRWLSDFDTFDEAMQVSTSHGVVYHIPNTR